MTEIATLTRVNVSESWEWADPGDHTVPMLLGSWRNLLLTPKERRLDLELPSQVLLFLLRPE